MQRTVEAQNCQWKSRVVWYDRRTGFSGLGGYRSSELRALEIYDALNSPGHGRDAYSTRNARSTLAQAGDTCI